MTAKLWHGARNRIVMTVAAIAIVSLVSVHWLHLTRLSAQEKSETHEINLSTSKVLITPVPGDPRPTNSLPTAAALSPDGRYLAILNNGYGTQESEHNQSIAVLDLQTNQLDDYPDARLGGGRRGGHQTYFLGLGFSPAGHHLYASIASITDYNAAQPGDTGNGVAVYSFDGGKVAPERFIKVGLQPLKPTQKTQVNPLLPAGMAIPYPAGLAVIGDEGHEKLLVADDLSDDALLIDAASGEVIHRFDLSEHDDVPAAYPYTAVATRDGKRAWVSLWNASQVDELDLESGLVTRKISLLPPHSPTGPGSHPTALLLSPNEDQLFVALANADRVAAVSTASGQVTAMLSTQFPGQKYYGTFPNALAQNAADNRLYVADASSNSVAVFDTSHLESSSSSIQVAALGFIPTEWYPTALAVQGGDLFVVTGKGPGPGPNSAILPPFPGQQSTRPNHPYIGALIHGSVARLNLKKAESEIAELTRQAVESNRMQKPPEPMKFASGKNPIRHVIYIIKENRTFDQILGDVKESNGDPSLVMYGEDITPNEHALARQFGILDNFYTSGEVSGNGHVWSTAAITSDYTEKTWEIAYRGGERLYDYEGEVSHGFPLQQGIPDVDEPSTGYLWGDVARAGLTYRHYGEFVSTEWCNDAGQQPLSPMAGTPHPHGEACPKGSIGPGEPLPSNLGQPHGGPSPWPWQIPMIARDVPTKPELVGHFDPNFPDFNLFFPDQLRVDEFLSEFNVFVNARNSGNQSGEMPQYVMLRLPNDHTMGTRPLGPKPEASVADNDLAVGRVADAISHSPYWDDTAIFILEDDAQDGQDHVDSHRSPVLVISRYAPGSKEHPFVDHHFYTTVNVVRAMESLLGLPPMNNNDAWADPMAELFSGPPSQPPYTADDRNLKNGLLYQTNPPKAPGGKASARMDFSHADAVDTAKLNRILWRERKGDFPMPPPKHTVFPDADGDGDYSQACCPVWPGRP